MTDNAPSPICIFVLGRPGSGKDTQAALLAQEFDLHQVKTSKLLMAIFKEKPEDPEVAKAQQMFEAGELATHEFVRRVVYERIEFLFENNFYNKKGVIFSGSPRTLHEAKSIASFCIEKFGAGNVVAMDILVDEQECIQRMFERNEKSTDRDLDAAQTRMEEFEKYTRPAIDYFAEKDMLIKVSGSGGPEQVHAEMKNALSIKLGYELS